MKVLVCGSRDYPDWDHVERVMDHLHELYTFTVVIHGNAGKGFECVIKNGADKFAGKWAIQNGIQRVVVPANWTGLAHGAGMIRNKFMFDLTQPDLVVAFPGSVGTSGMMRIAADAGTTLIATEDIIF